MAKKRSPTEEKLSKLEKLKDVPFTHEVVNELKKALSSKNNLIVRKAAIITGEIGIKELFPILIATFERFLNNSEKSDEGCFAKEAIISCLDDLEYDHEDIFLRGIRCFQPEPSYQGAVDTAAVLRGRCAFALVRIGYSGIVFELVELLGDPEQQARIAAIRALAGISRDQGEPLLRLKAVLGDAKHQVIAECLSTLMQISPDRSMSFVERFLYSEDMITAESAAFSLGESRKEEAFQILRRYREVKFRYETKEMVLTPMAVTRLEEAFEYLLDIINNDRLESALAAVKALEIFGDDFHRAKINAVVRSRNDPKILEAFLTYDNYGHE